MHTRLWSADKKGGAKGPQVLGIEGTRLPLLYQGRGRELITEDFWTCSLCGNHWIRKILTGIMMKLSYPNSHSIKQAPKVREGIQGPNPRPSTEQAQSLNQASLHFSNYPDPD